MGSFDAVQARLNANAQKPAADDQPILERAEWIDGIPVVEDRIYWLWADLVLGDAVNLVVAPGNTGKTRLAFELMAALRHAKGDLYGRKLDPAHNGIPCFYGMTTEMNRAVAQELARLAGLTHLGEPGQFVPAAYWWNEKESLPAAIEAYRKLHPKGLIVLDSITSLWNPDCTDAKEAADTIHALRLMGGTILVLHHENKDKDHKGSYKVAGNAAWVHQSDRLIRLKRLGDGGLAVDATRRGPDLNTVLSVGWDAPSDVASTPEYGERGHKRQECKDWIEANAELCTNAATVKAAWGIATSHGLEAAYPTFARAYQEANLT